MLINGKEYFWDEVEVIVGGNNLETSSIEVLEGITCVNYSKSGKRRQKVVSQAEWYRGFKRANNIKKTRLPRKLKKSVNKILSVYIPQIAALHMSPYKRILAYNALQSGARVVSAD